MYFAVTKTRAVAVLWAWSPCSMPFEKMPFGLEYTKRVLDQSLVESPSDLNFDQTRIFRYIWFAVCYPITCMITQLCCWNFLCLCQLLHWWTDHKSMCASQWLGMFHQATWTVIPMHILGTSILSPWPRNERLHFALVVWIGCVSNRVREVCCVQVTHAIISA